MEPRPPDGYEARAPTWDDAEAVARLVTACKRAEGGGEETTAEGLLREWEALRLAEDAIVVVGHGGRIVAYADVLNRRNVLVSVYGYVRPEQQGRGLGSFLGAWGENWAAERMRLAPPDAQVATQWYVAESNRAARQLAESLGYAPARVIYVMDVELEQAPDAAEVPAGIRLRTFVPGQDERVTFDAIEDAFMDSWGRPPGDYERWLDLTRGERREPGLWILAERPETGAIAGVCLGSESGGRGWIGGLGVTRDARRQGLGLALLRHAFGEYYRRGTRQVALSVDSASSTRASRLYERAGMRVTKSYLLFRKVLRAGVDMTAAGGDL